MKQGELFIRKTFAETHTVLGGYISPCHSSYLYGKLGALSIPNSTRNHLIELAIKDDPVWCLDPHMSMGHERNISVDAYNKLILNEFH